MSTTPVQAAQFLKPLIIRIEPCDVRIVSEPRERANGKVVIDHNQPALAVLAGRSQSEINISMKDGQVPYPAGDYLFSADSFATNRFHNLELNTWEAKLIPLESIKAYLSK